MKKKELKPYTRSKSNVLLSIISNVRESKKKERKEGDGNIYDVRYLIQTG